MYSETLIEDVLEQLNSLYKGKPEGLCFFLVPTIAPNRCALYCKDFISSIFV